MHGPLSIFQLQVERYKVYRPSTESMVSWHMVPHTYVIT